MPVLGFLPCSLNKLAPVQGEQPAASRNSEQRHLAFVVNQLAIRGQEVGQNALLFRHCSRIQNWHSPRRTSPSGI